MALVPLKVNLPGTAGVFDDRPREKEYFDTFSRAVQQHLEARAPDDTSIPQVFMQSPNGKVWSLQVNDAGAVVAVYVRG